MLGDPALIARRVGDLRELDPVQARGRVEERESAHVAKRSLLISQKRAGSRPKIVA